MRQNIRFISLLVNALFITANFIYAQDSVRKLAGHQTGTRTMVLSPSGNKLLTLGNDNRIKLWTIDNGMDTTIKSNPFELSYGIGFGKTDDDIFAVIENKCVQWNLQTGEKKEFEIFKAAETDKDHAEIKLNLVPFEDKLRLVDPSGNVLGVIEKGEELVNSFNTIKDAFHSNILWASFSPQCDLLAVKESGKLKVWNPATGKLIKKIKTSGGGLHFSSSSTAPDLTYAKFSPDLTRVGYADGNKVFVWNLNDDAKKKKDPQKLDLGSVLFQPIPVCSFDIGNDRSFVVSSYNLRTWSKQDKDAQMEFKIVTTAGSGFYVGGDETRVLFSDLARIKMCHFPSGEIIRELEGTGAFAVDSQWTRVAYFDYNGSQIIAVRKLKQ